MEEIIKSFGIDWKIFGAEIVNFLVVIGVLYFFLFRKIFVNLDKRKKIIADGVEKAQSAEKTLEDAHKKKNEIIVDARNEVSEKMKLLVKTSKQKEEEIVNKAKEKSEKILDNAKIEGEKNKINIISQADREIAKLAILGAEKILAEK